MSSLPTLETSTDSNMEVDNATESGSNRVEYPSGYMTRAKTKKNNETRKKGPYYSPCKVTINKEKNVEELFLDLPQ